MALLHVVPVAKKKIAVSVLLVSVEGEAVDIEGEPAVERETQIETQMVRPPLALDLVVDVVAAQLVFGHCRERVTGAVEMAWELLL